MDSDAGQAHGGGVPRTSMFLLVLVFRHNLHTRFLVASTVEAPTLDQ